MTRIDRINRWQALVEGVVADWRRLDGACGAVLKAGAMDPDGPLHEAIWHTFASMLARIDVDGWISWFIYDNECGKKAYEARATQCRKLRPIKTARDLARLIVESAEGDGGEEKAPTSSPLGYTGHTPCRKCGKTHWMHGGCGYSEDRY